MNWILPLAVLIACATVSDGAVRGKASYYADKFAGKDTASGEPYDPKAATCAHRTWPFDTMVEVRAAESGKVATCRVNDRGPFVKDRVLDVSKRVARELGMLKAGVIEVELRRR